MIIIAYKASQFDKKQNLLLLAHIMHIAHFLNLNKADMRLILCRWVTTVTKTFSFRGEAGKHGKCQTYKIRSDSD